MHSLNVNKKLAKRLWRIEKIVQSDITSWGRRIHSIWRKRAATMIVQENNHSDMQSFQSNQEPSIPEVMRFNESIRDEQNSIPVWAHCRRPSKTKAKNWMENFEEMVSNARTINLNTTNKGILKSLRRNELKISTKWQVNCW